MKKFESINILSGLTVAVVALPLALGFGITSGAGAQSGLVTAIVAGFLAALFGGSNYQVSGPTGAMTVILIPLIASLGISALFIVGILSGAIMIALGLFRAGSLMEKVPWEVLEGFTIGIAFVIAIQQVPLIFDVEKGEGESALEIFIATLGNVDWSSISLTTITVVCATLLIKFIWSQGRKRFRRARHLPASIVAVVVVTFGTLHLEIARIGEISITGLFTFTPQLSGFPITTLIHAAVVVALLGGIESLLAARMADAMVHRERRVEIESHDPNRELIGQGIATVGASMVGGMPATGAIARTSVNVFAGATHRSSAVIHALFLLAFITLFDELVAVIPLAVLGGVLLGTSLRIANPRSIREALQIRWQGRVVLLSTAIVTVAVDLMWAFVVGILLSVILDKSTSSRN
ncbi:MAG: SulP family inorganic anion transporter [Candidatus Nanopelagicaceae bacterium]